jgi:hypothetical protein
MTANDPSRYCIGYIYMRYACAAARFKVGETVCNLNQLTNAKFRIFNTLPQSCSSHHSRTGSGEEDAVRFARTGRHARRVTRLNGRAESGSGSGDDWKFSSNRNGTIRLQS